MEGFSSPRIEIFVWLTCRKKLNTRAKLAKLNGIPSFQESFPLCNESSEKVDHLYIIALFILSPGKSCWWEMKGYETSTGLHPHQLWRYSSNGSPPNQSLFFKKVRWAIVYIIIWSVGKNKMK